MSKISGGNFGAASGPRWTEKCGLCRITHYVFRMWTEFLLLLLDMNWWCLWMMWEGFQCFTNMIFVVACPRYYWEQQSYWKIHHHHDLSVLCLPPSIHCLWVPQWWKYPRSYWWVHQFCASSICRFCAFDSRYSKCHSGHRKFWQFLLMGEKTQNSDWRIFFVLIHFVEKQKNWTLLWVLPSDLDWYMCATVFLNYADLM